MDEAGLYEGAGLQAVDPKGRVAIPADFRSTIDRNSQAKIIVVGFHPTLPCLRAYDTAWSQSEERRFRKMADEGVDIREIERQREAVFGDVERASFDPSGRFILPEFFKDEAKIADWAFFVGAGPTFNIWAPDVLLASDEASPRLKGRCAHMMANRKARG